MTLTHPVLAALSAGSGALHLLAAGDHPGATGAAFALTAVAQLVWAALLLKGTSRRLLLVGAAGQAAVSVGYVVVHTVGWPIGPLVGVVEHVTAAGVVATVLEVAAALGALHALAPDPRPARRSSAVAAAAVVVVAVSGGAALGGEASHRHGDGASHSAPAPAPAHEAGAHGQPAAAPR